METEPLQEIVKRAARGERRSLIVTAVIAVGIVVLTVSFLGFTYKRLAAYSAQLAAVREDLEASQKKLGEVNVAKQSAGEELEKLQTEITRQKQAAAELEAKLHQVQHERDSAQGQLEQQRKEVADLTARLSDANAQFERLSAQIQESTDLVRYLHPIDFADAKNLYNTSSVLGELLVKILTFRDRNIPFNFANDPATGFTSPGFAAYVLQQVKHGPPANNVVTSLPTAAAPQLGDIIQYETGFALFYLVDRRGAPFVIGMTPKGIAALNVDFGVKRMGVLRTGLYSGRP
jgi:hypothetical protein